MVDICPTLCQPSGKAGRVNPQSPVLSHSALLRLVLSWLTVHLWALYCLYLFSARLTEAVHRQMNAS